jgi:hypothetical protein
MAKITKQCIIHSEKLQYIVKTIDTINAQLGEHIKESKAVRDEIITHRNDIRFIKVIGSWILGSSGLVGVIYGIVSLFKK